MHLALTGLFRAKWSAAASAFKAMLLEFIRFGHFKYSPIYWTV